MCIALFQRRTLGYKGFFFICVSEIELVILLNYIWIWIKVRYLSCDWTSGNVLATFIFPLLEINFPGTNTRITCSSHSFRSTTSQTILLFPSSSTKLKNIIVLVQDLYAWPTDFGLVLNTEIWIPSLPSKMWVKHLIVKSPWLENHNVEIYLSTWEKVHPSSYILIAKTLRQAHNMNDHQSNITLWFVSSCVIIGSIVLWQAMICYTSF